MEPFWNTHPSVQFTEKNKVSAESLLRHLDHHLQELLSIGAFFEFKRKIQLLDDEERICESLLMLVDCTNEFISLRRRILDQATTLVGRLVSKFISSKSKDTPHLSWHIWMATIEHNVRLMHIEELMHIADYDSFHPTQPHLEGMLKMFKHMVSQLRDTARYIQFAARVWALPDLFERTPAIVRSIDYGSKFIRDNPADVDNNHTFCMRSLLNNTVAKCIYVVERCKARLEDYHDLVRDIFEDDRVNSFPVGNNTQFNMYQIIHGIRRIELGDSPTSTN